MGQLSLVTFNCLGAPSPSTRRRLLTLAQELNRRAEDVVCLQEAQAHIYRRLLIDASTAYPHSAFEPFSYAPKGGLLTLARAPLVERLFTLYRAREIVRPPALMDWALHKGVLLTRMELAGVPVVVLNTHLSANYSVDWRPGNHYARVEQRQLAQLAEIVAAQPPEALVVAAGDFNLPRGGWLYDEFLAATGMVDPLAGDTRPTHRVPLGLPARLAKPIDFALVRAPSLPGLSIHGALCFDQPVPLVGGRAGYLSDHFGVELRVSWDT
jgi:endonuclease/exonuclease/phosphatase family metal-dependent hydrolase